MTTASRFALRARAGLSLLVGRWKNTSADPKLIESTVISETEETAEIGVFGATSLQGGSWGEAELFAFIEVPGSNTATAFTAEFNLGTADCALQAYVVKGVLVIVAMTRFKDGGARSNLFTKEFFYRSPKD